MAETGRQLDFDSSLLASISCCVVVACCSRYRVRELGSESVSQ